MTTAGRSFDPARFTPTLTPEQLLLGAAAFWTLAANGPFFSAALVGRDVADPTAWGYALALVALLGALHFLLAGVVAHGPLLKPVLAVVTAVTALASFYMVRLGVYLDPSMLRNVLHTDVGEAAELLSWTLVAHLLLYAALPIAALAAVRVERRPLKRALAIRAGTLLAAALVAAVALAAVFQPFASLMRNHKDARYLITPANLVWSLSRVASTDARAAAAARQPLGLDAAPGPSWVAGARPRVIVVMVGETARAANWGLNGYARQTTPELASLPVIPFRAVESCGTNTEVSLPCLFAPVGRRDYDEARIRGSESLLHVLARAGAGVAWRDNQSGCKGVCEGLPFETVRDGAAPGDCVDGHCFDEGLLRGLDDRLARARGVQVLVLHPIGSHGPAYFRRYPPAFARFRPACEHDDLRLCSREEIVNAYDNTIAYTDHVVAQLVRTLQAHADKVDTALVYVSDHGESLGENGLWLHGLPRAIAPAEQTRVPMLMWFSDSFARDGGLDVACLRRRAEQPASHDHLFHTLLGLADVRTRVYEPAWDLARDCRARGTEAPT